MLVTFVWTRVIDWFHPMSKILYLFYREENWTYLLVGSISFIVFSIFNIFCCVIPLTQRFIKFMKKKVEYESLPEDVNEALRRSSMLDLHKSARELNKTTSLESQAAELIFFKRRVNRRQTITVSCLPGNTSSFKMESLDSMRPWKSFNENASKVKDN